MSFVTEKNDFFKQKIKMKLAQIFCQLLFLGLFKKGTVLRAQAPLVGAEKEHILQMGDVTILHLCQYSG